MLLTLARASTFLFLELHADPRFLLQGLGVLSTSSFFPPLLDSILGCVPFSVIGPSTRLLSCCSKRYY